ncbi:hypothetical protein E1A91_D02G021400v1, partial [Gossypium mustelinum]
KLLPFPLFGTISTIESHVTLRARLRKGLRWIPRHPETRKGVVRDEMLRGVENKHRSGDSRIGQPFELLLNPWVDKRQPGELNHLSSWRKRKQKRFTNKSIVLLGKAVKCRTLDGDSLVAESITSLRFDPSSMRHVESRVNQQGPLCKAKYSWVTDNEIVP